LVVNTFYINDLYPKPFVVTGIQEQEQPLRRSVLPISGIMFAEHWLNALIVYESKNHRLRPARLFENSPARLQK